MTMILGICIDCKQQKKIAKAKKRCKACRNKYIGAGHYKVKEERKRQKALLHTQPNPKKETYRCIKGYLIRNKVLLGMGYPTYAAYLR